MRTTEPPISYVKHPANCTRCGKNLVLEQDPECPEIIIKKWFPLIVCNRCGKYLEGYRRLDDAIAFVCGKWAFVRGGQQRNEVIGPARDKLTRLTQEMERLLTERWNTTSAWSLDWVDLLIDKPEACRLASRSQETLHRRARENAEKPRELNYATAPD